MPRIYRSSCIRIDFIQAANHISDEGQEPFATTTGMTAMLAFAPQYMKLIILFVLVSTILSLAHIGGKQSPRAVERRRA